MKNNIIRFIFNCVMTALTTIIGGMYSWIIVTLLELITLFAFHLATKLQPSLRDEFYRKRMVITVLVYIPSLVLGGVIGFLVRRFII